MSLGPQSDKVPRIGQPSILKIELIRNQQFEHEGSRPREHCPEKADQHFGLVRFK